MLNFDGNYPFFYFYIQIFLKAAIWPELQTLLIFSVTGKQSSAEGNDTGPSQEETVSHREDFSTSLMVYLLYLLDVSEGL